MLLARRVSRQVVDEAEADHDQAEEERECQATYLHERDKLINVSLEQFFRDQKEM